MKLITKLAVLSVTISSLLAGRAALAIPIDAAADAKLKPVNEEPKKCDRRGGYEQQMETLKSDLKLNVNQEAAWTEWLGKYKVDQQDWKEHSKNAESWATLSAPDRIEKMLVFSKERIAKQEVRLAATKTFYATLSPEQRQTFDKGLSFGHHSHPGNSWKK